MVAHLQFPQIDPDAVTPSSFSEVIIQGILRDDLGYEGLVITDALDMDAIDTVYSPAESALRAIEAGNDLILLGAHISPDNQATAINAVVAAVREGTITQSRINQSVQRIITAKQRFDVLNWIQLEPNQAQLRINREAHAQLVDAMFEQGITQVHDDGNLFPLSGTTLMIYPATRGILGLACNRNDWQFVAVSRNPAAAEIDAAIRAAQFVDNIIVFTENVTANPAQQTLVGRLPSAKTAVVALWSPFDNLALSDVASYFVTYSPLSQSYMPICDILHGDAPALGTASLMLEAE